MADLFCAVCGEPWDAWGLHHGDVMAWEARLFKQGAGCPCCKGEPRDVLTENEKEGIALQSAASMSDAWDDPESFEHYNNVLASAVTGTMPVRPEWKEPERKVLWQCAGCNAKAVEPLQYSLCEPNSADDNEPEWQGGDKVHHRHGIAFARGDTMDRGYCDLEPSHTIDGKPYCDLCAQVCDGFGCMVSIFSRDELGEADTYAAGRAFPSSQIWGDSLCLSCFEAEESEAENTDDDTDTDDTDMEGDGA